MPANLVGGFGVGLILPSTANAAFGSLPPTLLSTGIGVFTVARQVGSALGVALLVAVYASPVGPAQFVDAVRGGFALQAGAAMLAMLAATQMEIASAPAPELAVSPVSQRDRLPDAAPAETHPQPAQNGASA